LARIESDNIEREISEQEERIVKARDKHGNPVEEMIRVTESYITTRRVSVSFAIYDLESGAPAWSGIIRKTVSKTNTYSDSHNPNDPTWALILHGLVSAARSEHYDYPSPAPLQEVLKKAFSGFAENMPKRK